MRKYLGNGADKLGGRSDDEAANCAKLEVKDVLLEQGRSDGDGGSQETQDKHFLPKPGEPLTASPDKNFGPR